MFLLKSILTSACIDYAFISEPQLYQCDAAAIFQYFEGEYCWYLNSHDTHDPELPLVQSRAHGGTLVLWRRDLDPYIKVVPSYTTAFLPVIFEKPGLNTTIHITLYMPTHGKDSEFISDLADLRNTLDELTERLTEPSIYIRGDGNINANNVSRVALLQQFMSDYNLVRTEIQHNTYHHFVGNGLYDSDIDILLHTRGENINEVVQEIICKNDNPAILSHHDIILSKFTIPNAAVTPIRALHDTAPRVDHTRTRISWSEVGQEKYCELITPYLQYAGERWLDPSSQEYMSVLLTITNEILTECATATNKYKMISSKKIVKSKRVPKSIKLAKKKMQKAHKVYKFCVSTMEKEKAWEVFAFSRKKYRQTVRLHRVEEALQRYHQLDKIFTKPATAHAYIRSCRSTKQRKIEKLVVGDEEFTGAAVCDGFYKSMTAIKQCNLEELRTNHNLSGHFINYENIVQLCQNKPPIPSISLESSNKILRSLKQNVSDYYSITALHYLHAGQEGLQHYNALVNGLIAEVNNSRITELNTAHGTILYKGHRKDRNSDRSYRNLSCCPFLAKSIDFYLRQLYHDCWDNCQASTQYQGTGSSHELASLLVTEAIQYSLHVSSRPVFILALDAQSAFDRCLRQVLCSELYKSGVAGSAILYMDSRLANRKTVYEWDGVRMGPAEDNTGFEQGGVNSIDYYKLYNNEKLSVTQSSELGTNIGSGTISAVGQADNVLLLADDIFSLKLLVILTEEYYHKYRVKLEPGKQSCWDIQIREVSFN